MLENASGDVSRAGQREAFAWFFCESLVLSRQSAGVQQPTKGKPGDMAHDVQVCG